MMRIISRILPPLVVALAVLAPAAVAKEKVVSATGMYGKRYCEYLFIKGKSPDLTATVWNTYGLNDCPRDQWEASDKAALVKQENALAVLLNGPRYWLIESASLSNPGAVKSFAGLRMRMLTTVKVPVVDGVPKQTPYSEVTVNRKNTFTWARGRVVYELLAPSGRRYVMQAYSQIVDKTLRRSQLAGLGARLKLPEGWRYRARRLKRDLVLVTGGNATVLQDELQNTYQRER
jgi:haloalkane dehalogenase